MEKSYETQPSTLSLMADDKVAKPAICLKSIDLCDKKIRIISQLVDR
jgi:hypothetical protein